jgi:hypothetical protein
MAKENGSPRNVSTLVRNCESTFPPNLDSRTILAVPHPTKQPNEKIRDKAVGKSIAYLERYYAEGERRYYIEANGHDYRVWKRTSGSEGRAIEIYQRYRFWAWWIEACCHWRPSTRFFTWIMHKTI